MARVEPQEIPVNRDLLNPKFEQYKLCLDDVPTKEYATKGGVQEIPLRDDRSSFQQLKLISQFNALFPDPWNTNQVYYVNNSLDVVAYYHDQMPSDENQIPVCRIPLALSEASSKPQFPISLVFADESHVLIAAENGNVFVAQTGNRGCLPESQWKIQKLEYGQRHDLVVEYATSWIRGGKLVIEAALLYVEEKPMDDGDSKQDGSKGDPKLLERFSTSLDWLTIVQDEDKWKIERRRKLVSKTAPDYVAIEPNGQAISTAGPHVFQFASDSAKPIEKPEIIEEMDTSNFQAVEPEYTWMQSVDDLTVHFMVPPETKKTDLQFHVTGKTIKFVHGGGKVLLEGELHSHVDPESSTWTLSENRIELTLVKKDQEKWQEVVVGDKRGKMVFTNEQMEELNRRLAQFTSDRWITAKDVSNFNLHDLEECDATQEEDILNNWMRFDGEKHQVTHKMDLSGNHFLFKSAPKAYQLPGAFIRYDVDALLIEPVVPHQGADHAWKHVATFDALGYVLASKELKKFSTASADNKYAAVCDANRNIFIYRSESPLETTLRNRKTGETVRTIGKQHVCSLEKPGNIVGLAATPHALYVLKENSLVVLSV